MATSTAESVPVGSEGRGPGQASLPASVGDFYDIAALLTDDERNIAAQVRAFAEKSVAPIINGYWARAEFPFQLIPDLARLGIAGLSYSGCGWTAYTTLVGLVADAEARARSTRWLWAGLSLARARSSDGGPRRRR